jgi:dTDP-4-dehydrorhamnose reductase
MILLLGATGYIGQAFARALRSRRECFIPLSRETLDYTSFELLFDYVRKIKPGLVINAAEFGDDPCLDNGEPDRFEMLQANTLLPQTVSRVCSMTNTPWGQVSSGDIYSGAKISENQNYRVEKDLSLQAVQKLFVSHPERFRGFSETDEPNFSFKTGSCTFYSGTKALAEEALRHQSQNYIWRFHLPFNEHSEPRNFLSQLQSFPRIKDAINSLSQVEDCASACLELWERHAPYGIYNVANPGVVTIQETVQMIQRFLKTSRVSEAWLESHETLPRNSKPSRSHCILDVTKLLRTGVVLRNVRDALQYSLEKWEPSRSFRDLAQSRAANHWR